MRIAYVRVSTEEQNEARQREALKQYRIEKWFCEKRSAKDTNRPQLEAMLEFARSGDTKLLNAGVDRLRQAEHHNSECAQTLLTL